MFILLIQASNGGDGSVTVTHNGAPTTITKSGECITHLIDCTSSVDFALSTDMVVLMCSVLKETLGCCRHRHAVIDVIPRSFSCDTLHTLLDALQHDLTMYTSIVTI